MIEDKELDTLEQEQSLVVQRNEIDKSNFEQQMDAVKLHVLDQATTDDENFVEAVKSNLKDAAVKHSQVEQKKAEFEGKKVDLESEKVDAERRHNQHVVIEDKWQNLQKRRKFHFDGVKPIMTFVGITEPMNLLILYFLTVILMPFYLLSKLIKGTFGTLISGAANESRSKAVKGFLWTIVAIMVVVISFCLIYLFLKWQGLDIFKKYTTNL